MKVGDIKLDLKNAEMISKELDELGFRNLIQQYADCSGYYVQIVEKRRRKKNE